MLQAMQTQRNVKAVGLPGQPEAFLKARSRAGFEAKSQFLFVKAVFHFVYRTIGVFQRVCRYFRFTVYDPFYLSNFASPSALIIKL